MIWDRDGHEMLGSDVGEKKLCRKDLEKKMYYIKFKEISV